MGRLLKRTIITLGAFGLLLALLLGLTQTSFFRDWLRDRIVAQGNEYLNGHLGIGELAGNLFTHLELSEILLVHRGDTVLFVPRLDINLSPSRLIHWELCIDSIIIDSPFAKLIQAADSTWNFSDLVRIDTLTEQPPPDAADTSDFLILLNKFALRDGSVFLKALDTALPSSVLGIDAGFTLRYSDTAQYLSLKEFAFGMEKPPFRLEQLAVDIARQGNKMTLGNLVIRTAQNQFGGGGTYVAADSAVSSGELASQPFDFAELTALVPAITLQGNPLFEIEARLERDSLVTHLGIIEPPQRIDLGLDIANVSKAMNASTHDLVRYYLQIDLTEFSLAHWLGDTAMDYGADGSIRIAGSGFTAETADISMDIDLAQVRALGRSVGDVSGSARYSGGNAGGILDAFGQFGEMHTAFDVRQVLDSQVFTLEATVSHLNLAPLLQDDSMASDINLTAAATGSGFDTTRLHGTAQIDLSYSTVSGATLDTATARLAFTAASYRLDTLYAELPIGHVGASGEGKFSGNNDLAFGMQIADLSPLRESLTDVDTLTGNGALVGRMTGTADSLAVTGEMKLQDLAYNAFRIESAGGRFDVLSRKDSLNGTLSLGTHRLGTGEWIADSVIAATEFTTTQATVIVDGYYRPGIGAHIESRLALDSTITANFPQIVLAFGQQEWRGGGPETQVIISGEDYRIENLMLTSPSVVGGEQTISLGGLFSMTGKEDFTVLVAQLDLESLLAPFNLPDSIGGRLNANLHLGGTAAAPVLAGSIAIDSGRVNQFPYHAAHGAFDYEAEKLRWAMSLLPYATDSLAISGILPVNLAFDNAGDAVYRDRPFEVSVATSGLPLSIVRVSGEPIGNVEGFITADMKITNTLDAPRVAGSFGLRDGAISMPTYGIEYSDVLASLSIRDSVLTLDTLQAMREKGSLTASGTLHFEKDLLTGVIRTTQFDLLANSFQVVKHKNYQVSISGDAELTGNGAEPRFAGNVTILRSSFYLPALMEEAASVQAMADQSTPMLVRATMPPDTLADTTGGPLVVGPGETDTTTVDWFDNLRGEFKVVIPRNTWLRSPDMNLEIGEGDLDLVKNGLDFELFGPLRIMRGQYNLYGKVFTIVQGELLFQGGPEYNPEVNMQAQYVFRTPDREKRTIRLDVSGKAFTPVLRFTLDDTPIEEKDAIAYVMYGRSMEELTSGQQSGAGAAQAELAKGAAASMLSNQLSQTLGSKLGLDVVDINSQGGLAGTSMTIGKYLTGDLFMSYQRQLGQMQDQEAAPDIVTLEYELNRNLMLMLTQGDEKTSGVGVIFKYQK